MRSAAVAFVLVLFAPPATADDALVAVAANFSQAMTELAAEFRAQTGHEVIVATGSTGTLYAQITNGAPYDVLLAADQERPALLEKSGVAVAGSRFTYATGRLVLWSANATLIRSDLQATLQQEAVGSVAIANPRLAPYGMASRESLEAMGAWDSVREKIVMGENVGQTFALVATGNAQLGFVSLSQVISADDKATLRYLPVSEDLHAPIRQDAVLLQHGRSNAAAIAFLRFLREPAGKAIISHNGYGVD